MKELRETVRLMNSSGYVERFIAEYWQVRIRADRLRLMLEKWDGVGLDFQPICPRDIYEELLSAMDRYILALEVRARIERIDLNKG